MEIERRPRYFDKDGTELKLLEWAVLYEDAEYRTIKQEIVGKYKVSTVWLGLNHNMFGDPPHIFETMVFQDNEPVEMERYSTLEQAIEGHNRLVKQYGE